MKNKFSAAVKKSIEHPHEAVGPLLCLIPHLDEQLPGDGPDLHLTGAVQCPQILRERRGVQDLVLSHIPAVGTAHTGGIKLYPPGLPALAVQLRLDEIGLILLLRVKQFLNHIFHIHSP